MEDLTMKKLKMARAVTLTFEEGYNRCIEKNPLSPPLDKSSDI